MRGLPGDHYIEKVVDDLTELRRKLACYSKTVQDLEASLINSKNGVRNQKNSQNARGKEIRKRNQLIRLREDLIPRANHNIAEKLNQLKALTVQVQQNVHV